MTDPLYIVKKNDVFERALKTFKEGIEYPLQNDLIRDGIIQRFEYCFELAWKTVKLIVEYEDQEFSGSPRSILQKAIILGILEDEDDWFRMLLERNNTVDLYNESVASEIYNHLKLNYEVMNRLCERIKTTYTKR